MVHNQVVQLNFTQTKLCLRLQRKEKVLICLFFPQYLIVVIINAVADTDFNLFNRCV